MLKGTVSAEISACAAKLLEMIAAVPDTMEGVPSKEWKSHVQGELENVRLVGAAYTTLMKEIDDAEFDAKVPSSASARAADPQAFASNAARQRLA